MIVGVDFDNTVVCYDDAFHRVAVARGLIPPDVPRSKEKVRDYLRGAGMEKDWTELQGYVYGARMEAATVFPGAVACLRRLRGKGAKVFIISHKTLYPYRGERRDLHEAARAWLRASGFLDDSDLRMEHVFFEPTKEEKLRRIATAGCTHFIDDLPEFLAERGFPTGAMKILFSPGSRGRGMGMLSFASWAEIAAFFEVCDGC